MIFCPSRKRVPRELSGAHVFSDVSVVPVSTPILVAPRVALDPTNVSLPSEWIPKQTAKAVCLQIHGVV
jgi:hypothetical protein